VMPKPGDAQPSTALLSAPARVNGHEEISQASSWGASAVYRGVYTCWGELVKCLCLPMFSCQAGPIAIVQQGWVAVMTRFGVYECTLNPGMYVFNPATQEVRKVCMKMQVFEIPRQAAMTRDNLSVQVDAVTFVTVVDPVLAVFHVDDYNHAVKILAASTLLRVIGEHDLQDIFHDRSKINERMTRVMQEKTAGWGVSVSSVEMRDITIPDSMQRAMAQIAEANREAQAKVIVAEGQRKSAFIFAEAAEAMGKHPMSVQLQWFETLRQIAAEKNSTVIVPDSVIGPLGNLARSGVMSPGPEVSGSTSASAMDAAGCRLRTTS